MIASTYAPQRWTDLETAKVQPNTKGIKGIASANVTTTFDTQVADDSFVRSIELITNGAAMGDTVTVQLVDKDGVYFPANSVLAMPVSTYNVLNSNAIHYESVCPFKILGGLYIRINYVNTNALTTVNLGVNFILLKALI